MIVGHYQNINRVVIGLRIKMTDIYGVDGYLVDSLKDYESDTFSASGCELTDEEAKQVADKLIKCFVDNRLDGVMIDEALSEVREDKHKAEHVGKLPDLGCRFCQEDSED